MEQAILTINDLCIDFETQDGSVRAVNGIDLSVGQGEIVGIVGESGCGKSVLCQSIIRLLEDTNSVHYEGEILFEGKNILGFSRKQLRQLRGGEISMIFQEPLTSLDPVYTIGNQLIESLVLHQRLTRRQAGNRALELLDWTGISSPERCLRQYPYELSGGMQQRVMIAMALASEPKLLIADEPTTALDVTVQAQILELLKKLRAERNMAILFISHDLGVVSQLCDRVKVMYLGEIIEEAPTASLFERPLHPYTQGLLAAVPRLSGKRKELLNIIEGAPPSLFHIPKGCRFSTRCAYVKERCLLSEPQVYQSKADEHLVKCCCYSEIQDRKGGGSK